MIEILDAWIFQDGVVEEKIRERLETNHQEVGQLGSFIIVISPTKQAMGVDSAISSVSSFLQALWLTLLSASARIRIGF